MHCRGRASRSAGATSSRYHWTPRQHAMPTSRPIRSGPPGARTSTPSESVTPWSQILGTPNTATRSTFPSSDALTRWESVAFATLGPGRYGPRAPLILQFPAPFPNYVLCCKESRPSTPWPSRNISRDSTVQRSSLGSPATASFRCALLNGFPNTAERAPGENRKCAYLRPIRPTTTTSRLVARTRGLIGSIVGEQFAARGCGANPQ
jgi:hypothetical protein